MKAATGFEVGRAEGDVSESLRNAGSLSRAVVAELRTLLGSRWDSQYCMHIPVDRLLVQSVCCGNVKWKWKSKAGL